VATVDLKSRLGKTAKVKGEKTYLWTQGHYVVVTLKRPMFDLRKSRIRNSEIVKLALACLAIFVKMISQ
jgi:hypothetical protein